MPGAVTVRFVVVVPLRLSGMLLVIASGEPVKPTVPVKLLPALVRVMALAPAVKVAAPAPVACVMAPV